MDQPTLSSNYPTIPSIHEIASLAEQRYRPPLLRRVSRSDPHIDESAAQLVSSALVTQNNGASIMTFDHTKSHSPMPASGTGSVEKSETVGRNFSSLNLGLLGSGEDNSNIGPLRKASSFIHGTSFGIGRKPSTSSLLHLPPSFQIGGGFSQVSHSATPGPEDLQHQGGLSMSATPNSLSVKPNNEIHHSASMGGGLFSNTNNDNNSTCVTSGIVPNNSSDSLNTAAHKSTFMGVFGRGFFAKPMRSEEENYRYIMSLDR